MNFCAAPALQSSEARRPDDAVKALLDRVKARASTAASTTSAASLPPLPPNETALDGINELTLLRDAALAWRATGDPQQLRLTSTLMSRWARGYRPRLIPEQDAPLDRFLLAYDLSVSALPVATRDAAIAFLQKLFDGYVDGIADPHGRAADIQASLVAMTAFSLDDRKAIAAAQAMYRLRVAATANEPDDTSGEIARLQALTMAALAARRHRLDWLHEKSSNGTTLQAALDSLARRITPGSDSDETQRQAGSLFHLAARLDARYQGIATRLSKDPPAWLAVCLPIAAR